MKDCIYQADEFDIVDSIFAGVIGMAIGCVGGCLLCGGIICLKNREKSKERSIELVASTPVENSDFIIRESRRSLPSRRAFRFRSNSK